MSLCTRHHPCEAVTCGPVGMLALGHPSRDPGSLSCSWVWPGSSGGLPEGWVLLCIFCSSDVFTWGWEGLLTLERQSPSPRLASMQTHQILRPSSPALVTPRARYHTRGAIPTPPPAWPARPASPFLPVKTTIKAPACVPPHPRDRPRSFPVWPRVPASCFQGPVRGKLGLHDSHFHVCAFTTPD